MTMNWLAVLALTMGGMSLRAQEPPGPSSPAEIERQQEQFEKQRQAADQARERGEQAAFEAARDNLKQVEKIDPKGYREQMALLDRARRREEILSLYRKGRLTPAQAKERLRPLVAEEVKPEIAAIPERIAALEREVNFLKKAREAPSALIDRRIDALLGLGAGEPFIAIPPSPPAPPTPLTPRP